MLLMALPNEHLMTFNQYKDAKTLFAAIQTRFGGNEATKKTQKTLLKQISLPSEWNTHVVVWRNKPDLDTMSFDDLYNNFKIVEQEVKGTASLSSSSSFIIWLMCHPLASLNEVKNTCGVSTATLKLALLGSIQPNGSQLVYEDLNKIMEDEIEGDGFEVLSDIVDICQSKVKCFNCHKMGHFARECRGPRNQDSRNRNQDSSRRNVNVEETSFIAMVAIDASWFWTEKLKQEKESNQLKIENFDNASKSLDKLIRSQIPDKSRKGVGFVSYNVVLPPPIGLFLPPNLDLSYFGLKEFQQPKFEGYGPKSSKSVSEEISNEANCNYHQRERVVSENNYTRVNYNYSAKKAHLSAHRNGSKSTFNENWPKIT
ncbi:ribonuclease H-like domain-containing protein [Tanacetum coccineum]